MLTLIEQAANRTHVTTWTIRGQHSIAYIGQLPPLAQLKVCCRSVYKGHKMQTAQLGRIRGAAAFGSSRPAVRRTVFVQAAVTAAPVSVPVKQAADGASAGSEELALKVAKPATAKGLVHRYLVYVQQNARRVRLQQSQLAHATGTGRTAWNYFCCLSPHREPQAR